MPHFAVIVFSFLLGTWHSAALAQDVSPPAMMQWFETSWNTMQSRTPDLFMAGYGGVWTPPAGKADQGNFSVGYDPYDRFDLGSPNSQTHYGTQAGLQAAINSFHQAGVSAYADMVWNHNGYSDQSTSGFYAAGGYPGLNITLPSAIDGDFHSAFASGDQDSRLAGLIDINQGTNFQMIRSPVPGYSNNIRAGTTPAFGRLANVPTDANRALYPDTSLNPISVYDPNTGEGNIKIYPYNLGNPSNGTPVAENALGYLMRNTQWLVQVIGYDGFRIDAAKNFPGYVLNYYDRAVYRSSFRANLDGTQEQIFGFSEAYDGNQGYLQTLVNKSANPNGNPGVIGGNRDVLDFPLFFALRDNLTGNGFNNTWYNIQNASFDLNDDGLRNGSQGVKFVQSADNPAPTLGNVAYAYTLLTPGNSLVYNNGANNGSSFPQNGRGDALGGVYGNAITKLVDIRNTHGRGNFIERFIEKENYAFERDSSMVVLLSNRTDAGYDSRTILTDFAPGTPLIELTGNAANSAIDPRGDIPGLVYVNNDHTINVRFLRNSSFDLNNNSFFHGSGYLVYGLSGPQGNLSLSNVTSVIAGATPSTANNGTQVLTSASVIKSNSFNVTLNTNAVNLLGFARDKFADGDNALLKIDGGLDLNGNGHVDYVTTGSVQYGFENFTNVHNPGWFTGDGNGQYVQSINTTGLADGYHYLTVRAFRHRDDNGPAVFTDFKQVFYVDRNKANSGVDSFNPITTSNADRNLVVRSLDHTANNVHVFLNLPASINDTDILAMVSNSNQASQTDVDLYQYGFFGLKSGNNVATIVTYRPTGSYSIQRLGGLYTQTANGLGLADVNFDGVVNSADIANATGAFEQLLYSQNSVFNPAADLNGDGKIDTADLFLLRGTLVGDGVDQNTLNTYDQMLIRRFDYNHHGAVDYSDYATLKANFGSTNWLYDLNGDGVDNSADAAIFASAFSLPEPSSLVLAALGALGLFAAVRKRRKLDLKSMGAT